MRSQGSSRDRTRREQVKRKKLKDEPRVSGALIRTLVKQLTTARPRQPSVNPLPFSGEGIREEQAHDDGNFSLPPCTRKQTRKRYHSSTPFQHRLLNMAEARREIVAALKLHRAAMNQVSDLHLLPIPSDSLLASFSSSPVNVSQSLEISLQQSPPEMATLPVSAALHPAMSEEEMAVIRSIAEQHDVELSDRLSMADCAWWCTNGVCSPPLEDLLCTHERSTTLVDDDLPWVNDAYLFQSGSHVDLPADKALTKTIYSVH